MVEQNKNKKKKAQLPFRLNILFFVVFLLFSILILQLGVVQILYGQEAQDEINRTENVKTEIPVPRGKMYDRFGNLIVDNEPKYAITYTTTGASSQQDHLDLAGELAQFIEKDPKDVTTRDLKDYFVLTRKDEAYRKLTEEEKEALSNNEEYQLVIDRITEKDLSAISDTELEIVAIKRELDRAYALAPQPVKNEGVTKEEYARVAEHLSELPGIDVSTAWDRKNLHGYTLGNYIGKITTSKEGIPSENLEFYLSQNYNRNDRVGISGLEQEYEQVLKGQKEIVQHTTDKAGNVINSDVIHDGSRGKDLVLTIDIELQQIVDKIIQEEITIARERHPQANKYLTDTNVVMIEPKTGDILAISGQHWDEEDKEFYDTSYNNILSAYRPGSAIKGATVLSGLDSGVIRENEVIKDRPIKLKDTAPKGSWQNLGNVNPIAALKESSNVFMFFIAMRLGGEFDYYPEIKPTYNRESFQTFRNYFYQFGLGVPTGVDMPYESTGLKGNELMLGKMMDFAIGQYDTYTPLQLAQYVSTIANDGYRIQPHLVKEIRNPSEEGEGLGSVVTQMGSDVLNKIEMDDEYIDLVQEGFRQALQEPGGTAFSYFKDAKYNPAGKTGTAENEVYPIVDGKVTRVNTENLTLVGYAPYDEPEVAFAVIVPDTGSKNEYDINKVISRRIMDAYFDLKEQRYTRSLEGGDSSETEETSEGELPEQENNNLDTTE
ncbi:penicillin-binding protein 2 [Bacillaceae bacterium S4-13-58]